MSQCPPGNGFDAHIYVLRHPWSEKIEWMNSWWCNTISIM